MCHFITPFYFAYYTLIHYKMRLAISWNPTDIMFQSHSITNSTFFTYAVSLWSGQSEVKTWPVMLFYLKKWGNFCIVMSFESCKEENSQQCCDVSCPLLGDGSTICVDSRLLHAALWHCDCFVRGWKLCHY